MTLKSALAAGAAVAAATALTVGASHAATLTPQNPPAEVRYHTVDIDGVDVFYRESGPRDAPVILLLHGFPSSSHMYRNLIPALADRRSRRRYRRARVAQSPAAPMRCRSRPSAAKPTRSRPSARCSSSFRPSWVAASR